MKLETIVRLRQSELMTTLRKLYKGKIAHYKSGKYLLVKGTAPILLLAHLDTVHKSPVKVICTSSDGRVWMSPQGIGGDDRCGVWALCELYSTAKTKPWLLFTCDEEIGGVGAEAFADDYEAGILHKGLRQMKLLIELDRKGSNEAVYYDCDNPELEAYITDKGFETDYGTYSDIATIAPAMGVAAVNLSAGYHNAHTLHEYIDLSQLHASVSKVRGIINDVAKNDFEKFEYIEAVYEPVSKWDKPYALRWESNFDSVPTDVPSYYRGAYAELLDYYSVRELEQLRAVYGDEVIAEIYETDFGYNDFRGEDIQDETQAANL